MKKLSKQERAHLWWSFAENVGDILDDPDTSVRMHHQLMDMLDEFVPLYEDAGSRYRRLLPHVAADLMPDDMPKPKRYNRRDDETVADLFNDLGDDVSKILKDDKTPMKVRQALIDFIDKMEAQAREYDPERHVAYQAQMLFPLTLDIVNDEDDEGYSEERMRELMTPAPNVM